MNPRPRLTASGPGEAWCGPCEASIARTGSCPPARPRTIFDPISGKDVDARSCPVFEWHASTKGRCHTCHIERGEHIGGYISRRPPDPAFEAFLNQPCDVEGCERTAGHNQAGQHLCNGHLDNGPSAPPAFARND